MRNHRVVLLALFLSVTFVGLCGYMLAEAEAPTAATQSKPCAQTHVIVAAATTFLNSLDAAQRDKVLFTYTPQKTAIAAKFKGGMGGRMTFVGEQYDKSVWSNFPVSDVPRPGLTLGSLTKEQREAAMHLLQVLLSAHGYQKVIDIIGADQILSESGTPFSAGIDYYTFGIFGTPSATSAWMVQFGGHHLGLNVTIVGEQGVLAPTLTGALPAVYKANGKTVRPLGQESDKAFALLDSLDDAQRKQAILNYRIGDLVLGPGHEDETIQPEGLQASSMNEKQRAMLLDLITEWAGITNDAYTVQRMEEIKTGLEDTWFAWSGPTTHEQGKNGTAYYRIQGPKLVIEFAPQGGGPGGPGMSGPTMHVHTVYRDPTNDYGRASTIAK